MTKRQALVVDDSSTAQYRLKMLLRPFDLDIHAVDSGEAALRFLEVNTPDVIFLDHLMPGMDGFRALQIIKSHPETATIPVIMYTSRGGDVYTGQARALGALDVVSKDGITATDLARVMRMIHIDPLPAPTAETLPAPDAAPSVVHDNAALAKLPQGGFRGVDRRAFSAASADQARALDSRLRMLELKQEDSQRALSARLVREVQSLRQDLKRELGGLKLPPQEVPRVPPRFAWTVPVIATSLVAGLVSAGLVSMHVENDKLQRGIEALAQRLPAASPQVEPKSAAPRAASKAPAPLDSLDDSYLQDLAWAFNQGGSLAYNRDALDRRALAQLDELLQRLNARGFQGTVEITISVGDFCALGAAQGQALLPGDGAKLGDCALSSKVYGLQRVADQYVRELNALGSRRDRRFEVLVRTAAAPEAYPEATANVSAREWNTIAQRNNRLDVRLTPDPAASLRAANLQAVVAAQP